MKQGAPRAVAVLAGLLERAAARGDADGDICGAPSSPAAGFRGRAVPGIPVRRYAERIYRYAGCSPACFVVAYVYLDRLAQPQLRGDGDGGEAEAEAEEEPAGAGGVVIVDSYSVHRLLVTAVMVAAKFMDDRHYNNAYFARVGGVEVAEMNALELRLLFALRFRLNVAPDTFARYCAALEAEVLLGGCPSSSSPGAQPPPVPAPKHGEEEEEERRREHHARQEAAAAAALRAAGSTAAFATAAAGTRRRLAAPALVEIAQ